MPEVHSSCGRRKTKKKRGRGGLKFEVFRWHCILLWKAEMFVWTCHGLKIFEVLDFVNKWYQVMLQIEVQTVQSGVFHVQKSPRQCSLQQGTVTNLTKYLPDFFKGTLKGHSMFGHRYFMLNLTCWVLQPEHLCRFHPFTTCDRFEKLARQAEPGPRQRSSQICSEITLLDSDISQGELFFLIILKFF